jgi:pilus assembly protein CpaF
MPALPRDRVPVSPDYALVQQLRTAVASGLRDARRERAEAGRAELDSDDERQLARSLISRAVQEHRREQLMSTTSGVMAMPGAAGEDDAMLTGAVEAALFGLGRLEPLLSDPTCVHVEINGCDRVWLYREDGRIEPGPPAADSDAELVEWVRTAATYSGLSSRPFDTANPWLELRLPDGSRLCALMGVVERPVVSIRLFRSQRVTLDDLAARGSFDPQLHAFLHAAVQARLNIVVSGETFSGKTTLLRALGNAIGFEERIVTCEHFLELGFDRHPDLHRDVVAMEERLPNAEGIGAITLHELVEHSRRLNPDRLIVGEVIGGEIVAMLDAMTQGEDGSLSTIHARDSRGVFDRISTYALTSTHRMPVEASGMLLAGALDLVVHMSKTRLPDGRVFRHVSSVREVLGFDGRQVLSSEVYATPPGAVGALLAAPAAPTSPTRSARLRDAGFDEHAWAAHHFPPQRPSRHLSRRLLRQGACGERHRRIEHRPPRCAARRRSRPGPAAARRRATQAACRRPVRPVRAGRAGTVAALTAAAPPAYPRRRSRAARAGRDPLDRGGRRRHRPGRVLGQRLRRHPSRPARDRPARSAGDLDREPA